MKRQSIHISIPQPCHEKWDKMNATERGAFCHSCSKEVIDFSTMTDREVIEYLAKNNKGCGRFRKDQVDTTLTMAVVDNGVFRWRALLFGILPLLSVRVFSAPTDQASVIKTEKKETAAKAKADPVVTAIAKSDTMQKQTAKAKAADELHALAKDTAFTYDHDTVHIPEITVSMPARDLAATVSGIMVVTVNMPIQTPEESKHLQQSEVRYQSRKEARRSWLRRFFRID